jgi:hypothetical protein
MFDCPSGVMFTVNCRAVCACMAKTLASSRQSEMVVFFFIVIT